MGLKYKRTPQDVYDDALCDMNDPSEPDSNMSFATGCKLLTIAKNEEYNLLIEAISESDNGILESIMEFMRAALIDGSDVFDAAVGAIVIEQFTAYLRPTIEQDKIDYDDRMYNAEIDAKAYQADCKITQMKEEAMMRKHRG